MTTPAAPVDDHPPPVAGGRSAGPGLIAAIAVAAIIIIGGTAWLVASSGSGVPDGERVTFVIPKGTAASIERGEVVTILPAELPLRVGDHLVVRNEDDEAVSIGPYTVRAGETLDQQYRRPQVLIGECSLSGTGQVRIVVT